MAADLPPEELRAAELDGELFAVDEGYASIDSWESPSMRAASLLSIVPARLIAELATAAWIHGARDHPPAVHELCAEATSRYRDVGLRRVILREVALSESEIGMVGRMRVTTPLRTVMDLLRCRRSFTPVDANAVLRLSELGGFTSEDVRDEIQRRRHLPAKLRALERLGALDEAHSLTLTALDQPPETR